MKCCDIKPSEFRTPFTVQRKVRTPNGVGGFDVTWEDTVSGYGKPGTFGWCTSTKL